MVSYKMYYLGKSFEKTELVFSLFLFQIASKIFPAHSQVNNRTMMSGKSSADKEMGALFKREMSKYPQRGIKQQAVIFHKEKNH